MTASPICGRSKLTVQLPLTFKMKAGSLLNHPVERAARNVLSVGLAAFFVWLVWSVGHAGYGTWTAMLRLTICNIAAERAKMANGG